MGKNKVWEKIKYGQKNIASIAILTVQIETFTYKTACIMLVTRLAYHLLAKLVQACKMLVTSF